MYFIIYKKKNLFIKNKNKLKFCKNKVIKLEKKNIIRNYSI